MRLGHVDRSPLGDLATTLSTVVACSPQVELRLDLQRGGQALEIQLRGAGAGIGGQRRRQPVHRFP